MVRKTANSTQAVLIQLAMAITVVAAIVATTGCGLLGSSAEPDVSETPAVAVVLDKTANSKLAYGVTPTLEMTLRDLVERGGYMSVVLASSNPTAVCNSTIAPPNNTSSKALEMRWHAVDGPFKTVWRIDDMIPAAGEVDLLESLRAAAETLQSDVALTCKERTIYVASSGIQTFGILDMTGSGPYGDVLSQDPTSLVSRIVDDTSSDVTSAEGFPNLEGIHVVWMGFGRLCTGPQPDMPASEIAKLKSLWTKVLVDGCHATFDPASDFVGADVVAEPRSTEGYPSVTPVPFSASVQTAVVTFDQNVIEFREDSDEYVTSQEEVVGVLEPYASALKSSGQRVVILGTTADGEHAKCRALGAKRASRFKRDLMALGVSEDQLSIASAGCEGTQVMIGDTPHDFYVANYDSGGKWDESVARHNRAIHIIPYEQAADVVSRFSA